MALKLNCRYLDGFVGEAEVEALRGEVEAAHALLYENRENAAGNAYHGWLTLPRDYDKAEFPASRLRQSRSCPIPTRWL